MDVSGGDTTHFLAVQGFLNVCSRGSGFPKNVAIVNGRGFRYPLPN